MRALAYDKEFSSASFKEIQGREGKPTVKIAVKEEENEKIILCQSKAREGKEQAILSKAENRYLIDLEKLKNRLDKGRLKKASKAQESLGRLFERHSRVARYYEVTLNEKALLLTWNRRDEKYETALRSAGNYFLRSSRKDLDNEKIWNLYMTLTRVEAGFKALKSELGLRPIYHHREDRCDSHIFITILAYRLLHWIEHTLRIQKEFRSW